MKRMVRFIPVMALICIAAVAAISLYSWAFPRQAQADFDSDSYPPAIHESIVLEDGSAALISAKNPGKAWIAVDDKSYQVVNVAAIIGHAAESGTRYTLYQNVDEAIKAAVAQGCSLRLVDDARSAFDFTSIAGIIDADGACTMLIDIALDGYQVDFSLAEVPDGYHVTLCGTYGGVSTYTLTRA